MRLGSVAPPLRLGRVAGAVTLIVAGCNVLAAVNGLGALAVGACLVTFGVLRLVPPPTPPPVSGALPPPAVFLPPPARERIVIERHHERRSRERYWPFAS